MTTLSDESRAFLDFAQSFDVLRDALASPAMLDVEAVSMSESGPLAKGATNLKVNPANVEAFYAALAAETKGFSCMVLRNVLQYLDEYRRFLTTCFDRLAIGGFLLISVPHQFLYERKRQLPSRRERRHVRFYTPDILLSQIEEALDPCDYRLRLLVDNDRRYDYNQPLHRPPPGGQHIILCLQKIARPTWRDAMEEEESWTSDRPYSGHFVKLKPDDPRRTRVIEPDTGAIKNILVMKLDHRGDFIMADAAFELLREQFPQSSLTLVCGPWNFAESQRMGLFDRIIPFAFFPEDDSARTLKPSRRARLKEFAELAPESYDLAIDLRLYNDTRELIQIAKARHKAGFDRFDEFPWLTMKLNVGSPTIDHRAEQYDVKARAFRSAGPFRLGPIDVGRALSLFKKPDTPLDLVYAPRKPLAPGRYRMEIMLDATEAPELAYRVSAQGLPIAEGVLPSDRTITFEAPERLAGFELRLSAATASPAPRFAVKGMRIDRAPFFGGLHQREAMALLVKLAGLRLQSPFIVSSS